MHNPSFDSSREYIMSKREQNKQAVREKIIKESLKSFSTKGTNATTVADIVSVCDIGRGTFYNYFNDIHHVMNVILEEMYAEIRVATKKAREKATNLYQMLYCSFKVYLDYVSQDDLKEFHRLNQAYIRSASYENKVIRSVIVEMQEDLKKLKDFGEYKENYELQLLSVILVGTPVELFLNIHKTNIKTSNAELADFMAKLFTKAMKPSMISE